MNLSLYNTYLKDREKARKTMFNTMLIRILVTPKANICQHESHATVLFLEEFCSIMSNIIKLILVVLNCNCKLSVTYRVVAWHELSAFLQKFLVKL